MKCLGIDDAYVMFIGHNSSQKTVVLYFFFTKRSVKFDHSLLLNVCLGVILYLILYQILLLVLQQNSSLDVSQTYDAFKPFGIPINFSLTKNDQKKSDAN